MFIVNHDNKYNATNMSLTSSEISITLCVYLNTLCCGPLRLGQSLKHVEYLFPLTLLPATLFCYNIYLFLVWIASEFYSILNQTENLNNGSPHLRIHTQ